MTSSLWGDLPTGKDIVTPAVILNEQIAELQRATKGLLRGKLNSYAKGDQLEHHFHIIVPSMNEYSLKLLHVTHGIDLYPSLLYPTMAASAVVQAPSEEKFREALGRCLQHPKTHAIIAGLLAQIHSQGLAG